MMGQSCRLLHVEGLVACYSNARGPVQVFQTKRKAYNASAARAPGEVSDGTFGEAPAMRRRSSTAGGAAGSKGRPAVGGKGAGAARKAQPKWKAQSSQLRAAMAAARGASSGPGGAAIPFVPSEPDEVGASL